MKYIIRNYKPLTIPNSIDFEKITEHDFILKINGSEVKIVDETNLYEKYNKIEPKSVHLTKSECKDVKEEFDAQEDPYPYSIIYNKLEGKQLPHKAAFINWSDTPGVARMLCSNGRVFLVPVSALKGRGFSLPYNDIIR